MKIGFPEKNFYYSMSDQNGEAEQKLFSYIYKNNMKQYIIVGIDNDLIILNLLYRNNIGIQKYDGNMFFPKKQPIFKKKND